MSAILLHWSPRRHSIDLDALDENVQHMAALTSQHGIALPPHAEAHESSAIAEAQIEMGASAFVVSS